MQRISLNRSIILPLALLVWIVVFLCFMLFKQNESFYQINMNIVIATSFYAGVVVMMYVIRNHSMGFAFYSALGLLCLQLSNLYDLLFGLVSKVPPYLTVSDFSTVCTYLFFISALIELKTHNTNKFKMPFLVINIFAAFAVVAVGYAVIINNVAMMPMAYFSLDLICIIISCTMIMDKTARLFSSMVLLITLCDAIMQITDPETFVSLLAFALLPICYVLLAHSITHYKAGEPHVG